MPKSSPEQVVDFLLDFLPSFLPKPVDSAVKSAIESFRSSLDEVLKEPRIQRELLEAAQKAESEFRRQARIQLENDDLVQAVASFPLFDRDLFQSTLADLPNHLREEYLAQDLQTFIDNDWKGRFFPEELRKGVALYINCLRVELLKVEGFADVVTRLATLRTDQRTDQILAIVTELSQLVKLLVDRGNVFPQIIAYGLFTIPQPLTDFTGREQELNQLKESFLRGAIITGLSGAGGIGKTELARKLAHDIADNYPDAQISIDLQGTSENPFSSEDAMRRLLEPFHMGQKLPDDESQLKGLYQQTFKTKKVLLLLDNAANGAQVRPLIPPAPSAAIITSRQHFSLTEFGLRDPVRLDVLSPEKARELLRGASPKLNDSPNEEANQLAKLCGHLPLALRVVASLLNDRPDWMASDLIKRLTDERTRLQRLKREGDVNLDVDATLSLSYELLDDRLKKRFRNLGIFTAPFAKVSAKAVLAIEDDDELDDILGKLILRSLLSHQKSQEIVQDLYSMHDLTRLYVIQKLLDEKEYEEILTHHADHFLKWASEADDLYLKGNENVLLGLLNFRFIWEHLFSTYERFLFGQKTFSRPQIADRWLSEFPRLCPSVLNLHLLPRQKILILQNALEAARRLADKVAEADHLGNLGLAYVVLGDVEKAINFYEQILAIHRELRDRQGEGSDLSNMGNVYAGLGEISKAIEYYQNALEIFHEIGERKDEAHTLGNLGNAYMLIGDMRKSIDFCEQSLLIHREIGDRVSEGHDLTNLGLTYAILRNLSKAIECYEKSLAIALEFGDRRGESFAARNLGSAYLDLKQTDKAIKYCEKALVVDREIGDRGGEGADLGNLGVAYKDLGQMYRAIEYYEQALVIAREIGARENEGDWLANLGMAYKKLGEKEKAGKLLREALIIYQAIESPRARTVQKWLAELN
ncbi:MAG: tetratricopeptide repeat protein [Chloroflexota bacterium]